MRKYLIPILIITAAIIYSWDALLFVRPRSEGIIAKREKKAELSIDKLIAGSRPVRFVNKGRNPFFSRRIEEKPAAGRPVPVEVSVKMLNEEPKPPDIKVGGLIWNQDAPLAMITLPDGSSGVAKVGDNFGDITVKKIEKNRMLITCRKRDYWITW